jgi:hypothetical protein
MGPRVYAVRTGDRYGPEYEDYINSKVPNVTWIREETIGKHQWNKLIPMSLDIDEPVCVIDIDVSFINDYMDLFNYPIERGQFVATQSWYKDTEVEGYKLQGGFQKYYPKDCKYIYDKFVSDPEYWMEYYIKNGTTCGPVNGEQYFVEDSVKEKLDLKFVPAEWMTRWENLSYHDSEWLTDANIHYPGEYLYLGGEFNPDVRLLHFQGLHKPHSIIREVRGW